ncbi:MAG: sigma-70 family RNA polymerase sigma factor, partial [Anaerohalosphaera sp.]|nr:sigma-70 family RNA polymerase sigma factor [Anaerohalosphaera sp.]
MKSDIDLEQIIELAASGDSKCCEQLVLHITPKIQTYIFRSTLDSGITEDLSQEVFCKMLGALSTLNDVNSFWPWLYRIASNCVNTYYRKRTKHDRIVNYQQGLLGSVGKVENSVDAELMSKELELAVMEAVATLKPKHRQIINLRCLEDMSFKEISRIERTSEVYTRVLFHRTLERLRITLEKQGFQKVSLVLALSIFGSLTSVSKAAATGVSVTAASVTGIGTVKGLSAITAKLIKIFSTVSVHQAKLTVAAVVIAAIITTVATTGPLPSDVTSIHYVIQGVTPASDQTANAAQANKNASSSSSSSFSSSSSSSSLGSDAAGTQYQTKGAYENKLYMPQGPQGPVMRFMQRWNIEQTGKLCSWLQDGSGYYYYAAGEDKTYITNDPLKMLILPTDPPELVKFIHSQAGYDSRFSYERKFLTGLVKHTVDNRVPQYQDFKCSYSYNSLSRSDLSSTWPKASEIIDIRDQMHKRGWTYFKIAGDIDGKEITGAGRMPFIYAASEDNWAWLRLR